MHRVPNGTHKPTRTWSAAADGQAIVRYAPTPERSGRSGPSSSRSPSRSRGDPRANWDAALVWAQSRGEPGRPSPSVYVQARRNAKNHPFWAVCAILRLSVAAGQPNLDAAAGSRSQPKRDNDPPIEIYQANA